MLLTINIGNSSIRLGIFDQNNCIISWIIDSKTSRTIDDFYTILKSYYRNYEIDVKAVQNIVVGSVVPKHTPILCEALKLLHNIDPLVVNRNNKAPIKHHSDQMGTDLFANAVHAYMRYKRQSLIIDFGTALTLIAIDANGEVLGVIIAPGMNTALQALIGNTAQLTDIELIAPHKVLGLDTISCMQSGIIYGYLSMVEGLIDRVKNEIGQDTYVIATGGLCHIFEKLTKKINVIDKLHTIKGLKNLFELHQNSIKATDFS